MHTIQSFNTRCIKIRTPPKLANQLGGRMSLSWNSLKLVGNYSRSKVGESIPAALAAQVSASYRQRTKIIPQTTSKSLGWFEQAAKKEKKKNSVIAACIIHRVLRFEKQGLAFRCHWKLLFPKEKWRSVIEYRSVIVNLPPSPTKITIGQNLLMGDRNADYRSLNIQIIQI